ncbi:MAG TPA: FapA family protein [Bacillota bacterium]|nr:FapA family protein [Bacillota bacterium]
MEEKLKDNEPESLLDSRQNVEELVEDAVANIADLDGIRVLEFQEDGIYLTVYPPMGTGLAIEPQQIFSELAAEGVTECDQDLVDETVAAMAGTPVKIGAPVERKSIPGQIYCRMNQDEMQVFVRVVPPKNGGVPVTKDQILAELNRLRVVHGVDEDSVQRAVDLTQAGEEVLVATGTPMEPGQNAQLEYNFRTSGMVIQPKELADGRVDFYNLDLVENVLSGAVLVTKKPLTNGVEGKTVTGRTIPTKPGKDIVIKAGKNTELIDDNTTLIATANGHVVNQGGKISVFPIYEVPGDVNLSTGNVEFVGNVVVKGNITEGFVVKAQGDVEVRGSIAGGNVIAQGHLQVKNGIQGMGKNIINVEGNVFTKFIENATVVAKGDIVVGEAIMHSKVSAGANVMVGGRKGVIVGGLVRAAEEITAKIVGSNLATSTELEAGVQPELRERYNKAEKELADTQINLEKTQKAFVMLKTMEQTYGELPTDKKAMLVKVSRAQYQMMAMIQQLQEEFQRIQEELDSSGNGKINVSNIIHSGVKVTIGNAVMFISDPIQFVSLVKDKGEIKTVPLK